MNLVINNTIYTFTETATDTDATPLDAYSESDMNLYMSQPVYGKTIDDCYSMLVSIRNSILLLVFVVFIFEAHKLLKNSFSRHSKC